MNLQELLDSIKWAVEIGRMNPDWLRIKQAGTKDGIQQYELWNVDRNGLPIGIWRQPLPVSEVIV